MPMVRSAEKLCRRNASNHEKLFHARLIMTIRIRTALTPYANQMRRKAKSTERKIKVVGMALRERCEKSLVRSKMPTVHTETDQRKGHEKQE